MNRRVTLHQEQYGQPDLLQFIVLHRGQHPAPFTGCTFISKPVSLARRFADGMLEVAYPDERCDAERALVKAVGA